MQKDIYCEKCGRYLKIKAYGTFIASVTCTDNKCKHINNIKIVSNNLSVSLRVKFEGENT